MAFHEVQFPVNISYGSRGGPGFKTSVVELDSGSEERIAFWANARRSYNAKYGVKSLDDLSTILSFYVARQGIAYGFRYKDWLDFTTKPNHRDAPAFDDVVIGVGDGTKTDFQILKTYISGAITRTRNITKPVSGTVKVGVDGIEQSSGFSVDTTVGKIIFNTAPLSSKQVTAGCEFDVPVRFGVELDDVFSITYDAFDDGSLDDIPIIEIIDDGEVQDEYFYGGAINHGSITNNLSLSVGSGRVQVFNAAASGLKILLPDDTNLSLGGPYFFLVNEGGNQVEVRTSGGLSVGTINATSKALVFLGLSIAGAKYWVLG